MQNGVPPEGWPPGYGPNGQQQNLSSTNPFVNQNAGYTQQIPAQGWPPGYVPNTTYVQQGMPPQGWPPGYVQNTGVPQQGVPPQGWPPGYGQNGQNVTSTNPFVNAATNVPPTKNYDDYVDFGQMHRTNPAPTAQPNYLSQSTPPTPVGNTGSKYDDEFFGDASNPRYHSNPVSPAPSQQVPGRTRAPSNPFRNSGATPVDNSVSVADASIVNNTAPTTSIENKALPIVSRNTMLKPLTKKPISVFATPDAFVLRNARSNNEDPLIIERKGANPGAFTRFKDKDRAPDTRVATFIDAYAVMGIINLENESFLILVTEATMIGSIRGAEIFCVTGTKFISFDYRKELDYSTGQFKPPSSKVQKFVEEGNMYFSYDYHLTHTVQRQEELSAELQSKPVWKVADKRFFWNRYLMRHFISKRLHEWISVFVRGSFQIDQQHFMPETKEPFDFCLFTRNSCMRAGTRYNTRGINDDGNVANFWETEQLVVMQDTLISFVQIRGSVPIFWEEKPGKLTITRPPEAAAPAFRKHIEEVLKLYKSLHIVNLLTKSKSSEESVTQGYEDQLRRYKSDLIKYNYFDFHAECGKRDFSGIWNLIHRIQKDIEACGFYMWSTKPGKQHTVQRGIYRTNCLDCLDRTNVTQTAIARAALSNIVIEMGGEGHISEASRLGQAFNTMWANHGDVVSKVYAGTGAMKSSYTRKGKSTLAGLLDDGVKSVTRLYHAKFSDENKQEAIDFFLGTIEDFQDDMEQTIEEKWVQSQLNARSKEFTTIEKKRVFVGTYNVNAQVPPNKAFDLDVWFNPKVADYDSVDVWIVGFQEIVDLGVGSVMSSSPSDYSKRVWEEVVTHQINLRRQKKVVMLRSEQLVGILMCVFVSEDIVNNIKNLHLENSKTGLYGLYGNKGALAVRFDYNDSSFCFVCAHLSAGQNNVNDRISDIEGITSGIRFGAIKTYGSTIMDNDYVFWLGDFNFRLNVPYFEALTRITEKNWEYLKRYDQLRIAKSQGLIFRDFEEGNIDFAPTYKYDSGTDRYDTSEKQRVPAWTDRILYFINKNNPINRADLETYGRCEMQFSDHRPMRAVFAVDVRSINRDVLERVERELFKQAKTLDQKQLESSAGGPVDNKLADVAHLEVRQLPHQIGANPQPPPLPAKGPLSTSSNVTSGPGGFTMPPPLPSKTAADLAALQAKLGDMNFNPRPNPAPVVRTTFDEEFGENLRGGNNNAAPRPVTNVPTPANFVPKPGRSIVGNEIDKYGSTISTVINEIQGAVGNVQTLMSSVNLLGSTLKALINYLSSLNLPDANQNNKAKEFIQKATDTGQLLVASARMAVSDPSSAMKHQQLMNNCYFLKDVIMLYSRYF